MRMVEYSNPAGERISFYQYAPDYNIRQGSTSGRTTSTPCRVGEYPATITYPAAGKEAQRAALSWGVDGWLVSIEFGLDSISEDEAILMAESTQP